MTFILELISKGGQAFLWFIGSVVIPVTVWFTLVRSDISHGKEQIIENKERIDLVDKKVDDLNDKVTDKMDRIIQDLGVIKGELKRIK